MYLLVEGEHEPSDSHLTGYLERHPPHKQHLLSCVRMVGRVIQPLGLPQLILCSALRSSPSSDKGRGKSLLVECPVIFSVRM